MAQIKILDCTLRDGGYINEWNFLLFFKTVHRKPLAFLLASYGPNAVVMCSHMRAAGECPHVLRFFYFLRAA